MILNMQAGPQKDTNVCGDILPKVLDKLKSVKMEGLLVHNSLVY